MWCATTAPGPAPNASGLTLFRMTEAVGAGLPERANNELKGKDHFTMKAMKAWLLILVLVLLAACRDFGRETRLEGSGQGLEAVEDGDDAMLFFQRWNRKGDFL